MADDNQPTEVPPFDMAEARAIIKRSDSAGSDGYVEYWGPDALEQLGYAITRIEALESALSFYANARWSDLDDDLVTDDDGVHPGAKARAALKGEAQP